MRRNTVHGPAAWDGTSVVALGAGILHVTADGATPWLARLFAPCATGTCARPGCR